MKRIHKKTFPDAAGPRINGQRQWGGSIRGG